MLDLSSFTSLSPSLITKTTSLTSFILTAATLANNTEDRVSFTTLHRTLKDPATKPQASKILGRYFTILPSLGIAYHLPVHLASIASLGWLIYSTTGPSKLWYGASLGFELMQFATAFIPLNLIKVITDVETSAKKDSVSAGKANTIALETLEKLRRESAWRFVLINGPCFIFCLVGFCMTTY